MLPPLVSTDDLSSVLGPDLDAGKASYAVGAASAYIRSVCRTEFLADDGTLEDPLPDAVYYVALNVARRVYVMPDDGVTQETVGPFAYSTQSGMWLSKADREMLAPYMDGSALARSITPGGLPAPPWRYPSGVGVDGFPASRPFPFPPTSWQ